MRRGIRHRHILNVDWALAPGMDIGYVVKDATKALSSRACAMNTSVLARNCWSYIIEWIVTEQLRIEPNYPVFYFPNEAFQYSSYSVIKLKATASWIRSLKIVIGSKSNSLARIKDPLKQ